MSIHRHLFLTVKPDDFIESKTVHQFMHKTNREIQDQSVGCICHIYPVFVTHFSCLLLNPLLASGGFCLSSADNRTSVLISIQTV